MASSISRSLSNSTVRVVAALLLVAMIVWFFPVLPTALRWPSRVLVLIGCIDLVLRGVSSLRRMKWSMKGVIFSSIMMMFMLGVVHILCLVFMQFMSERDDRLALRGEMSLAPNSRQQINAAIAGGDEDGGFHQKIGWVPRAGQKWPGLTINSQGFRALHDYSEKPSDRDKRVLCMGDSFTYGVGVKDDQTYPFHAEQLAPGWEWLNFGIPGTCLTQAYMHYVENARKFDGKHVIIGFMTNDAQRTVNCFRPFVNRTSGCAMTKPFAFLDKSGEFSIKPNPYHSLDDYRRLLANERVELHKLLQQDYLTWGRTGTQVFLENPIVRTLTYACVQTKLPMKLGQVINAPAPVNSFFKSLSAGDLYGDQFWDENSRGFKALCGMFDLFYTTVQKDGRIPHIVIIPGPHDVDDYVNGDPRQYQSLIRFLDSRKYHYLDFLDTLVSKHKNDLSEKALFVVRHYQGHVNKELAEKIIEMIPEAARKP